MNKKKIIKYISLSVMLLTILSIPRVSAAGFKYADKYIQCGNLELPYGVAYIVGNIVNIIKIAVPILLIIMGMIDFLQAVIANDEKQMKEKTNKFIKRIIAAVIVFFVVAIVQFVFGQVISGNSGKDALSCVSCFIGNDSNCNIVDGKNNHYNTVENNDTSCDIRYVSGGQKNSMMYINFESKNCKFTVTNTTCRSEYDDAYEGESVTSQCSINQVKNNQFTVGINQITNLYLTFDIKFSNGETTTVKLKGNGSGLQEY